jgi:hypothetical protein
MGNPVLIPELGIGGRVEPHSIKKNNKNYKYTRSKQGRVRLALCKLLHEPPTKFKFKLVGLNRTRRWYVSWQTLKKFSDKYLSTEVGRLAVQIATIGSKFILNKKSSILKDNSNFELKRIYREEIGIGQIVRPIKIDKIKWYLYTLREQGCFESLHRLFLRAGFNVKRLIAMHKNNYV